MPSRLDEYGQFMQIVATRSGEVIRGGFDASLEVFTGTSPWDVSARSLAISEAGCKVSTLTGGELIIADHVDGSIMTNGRLHEIVVDIARRSLADDSECA